MDILLVDDHALVREGISYLLQQLGDDLHIWQAISGEEAIDLLKREPMDMVLLDLNLPGMDGFTIMGKIMQLAPATPVVILSAVNNAVTRARCLANGARAYINKSSSGDQMLHILRAVLNGERMNTNPQIAVDIDQAKRITQRQREILRMLQQGMRNKAIAVELDIQDTTVKAHIRDIFRLLHVNNRHAAVCKADQLGLLSS